MYGYLLVLMGILISEATRSDCGLSCWFSEKGSCTSPSTCLQVPTNVIGILFFNPFSWSLVKIKCRDPTLNPRKAEPSVWQGTCKLDCIHHDRFCGKITLWLGSYQPAHLYARLQTRFLKPSIMFSDRGTQWLGQILQLPQKCDWQNTKTQLTLCDGWH